MPRGVLASGGDAICCDVDGGFDSSWELGPGGRCARRLRLACDVRVAEGTGFDLASATDVAIYGPGAAALPAYPSPGPAATRRVVVPLPSTLA